MGNVPMDFQGRLLIPDKSELQFSRAGLGHRQSLRSVQCGKSDQSFLLKSVSQRMAVGKRQFWGWEVGRQCALQRETKRKPALALNEEQMMSS